MSIVVNSRPIKTINGIDSKWIVSGLPIVYTMTRKDQAFNLSADSSGFLRLQISSVDVTALFTVTDQLYVKSNDGTYHQSCAVTAVSFSGGHTLITTDIPYIAVSGAGYINFITTRPLYHLEVQVYNLDNHKIGPVREFTPAPDGSILVDCQSFIASQLSPVMNFTFADINKFNPSIAYPFYIKYTEVWEDSAESETDDVANIFWTVLGKMNLRESNIPSLYDYSESIGNTVLTKWLKRADEFVISRDYKTYLSFIISDEIPTANFKVVVNKYKGGVLDSITTVTDSGTALWDLQLDEETDEEVTSMTVQITDDNDDPISEVITYIYECFQNEIKLLWRNSLGGLEEYYFDYNSTFDYQYPSGRKAKRLTSLGMNVSRATWEAINELNSSANVYRESVLEVTPDTYRTSVKLEQQVYLFEGGKMYGVVVIPTAQSRESRDKRSSIEIQIEYPEGI